MFAHLYTPAAQRYKPDTQIPQNSRHADAFRSSLESFMPVQLPRLLFISSLLLVISSMSWAQSSIPAAPATPATPSTPDGGARARLENMSYERIQAHRAEKQARALELLKYKLQLQAGQEQAWSQFVAAVKLPTQPLVRRDRTAMESMTTPERMERMQAFKAERDAMMQKRMEATKIFYAGLSAEQKKVFDEEARHWMKGPMGRGGVHPAGMQR
jgi:hypothetical protein